MRTLLALGLVAVLPLSVQAQEWAEKKLEASPRHQEWVKLKHDGRTVDAMVVFPEVKDKAKAVVVIHEIFGLTDWAKSVADDLAAAGYIAIAPDLLSGTGPEGGGTDSYEGTQQAMRAIRDLPDDQITADLKAAVAHVRKLPACNGEVAVCGFCWGGGQAFRFAANADDLTAAYVFYGTGPDAKLIDQVKCPVYGFYGENDARVNSTIDASKERMKEAGKTYEPVVYDGAGHGFMRAGEEPDPQPANRKARTDAWQRWKKLLAEKK